MHLAEWFRIFAIAMLTRGLLVISILGFAFPAAARELSLEDRLAAQHAIEDVYWRHRVWPRENGRPKPRLDELMPALATRAKVEDYLRKSHALESIWHRPLTAEQLQAELDRMGLGSRDPQLLRELFEALGNDPFVIAETLARPALAERLIRTWHSSPSLGFDAWWQIERSKITPDRIAISGAYRLPVLSSEACVNDTWSPTSSDLPDPRYGHTSVWTGTEMIVWGGHTATVELNTGGRYTPATDTWVPTSTSENLPIPRTAHTAIWTGTEMIVWGGIHEDEPTHVSSDLIDGGRYDPLTDSWNPIATAGAPAPREEYSVVWTGTEMIVWGGVTRNNALLSTGGRYDPKNDSWSPTSTATNTPSARYLHTAVWTGSEMIVWGGAADGSGARYDPSTDHWIATSLGANMPAPRRWHVALWTGTEMIVWGGVPLNPGGGAGTGARYDPITDSWQPMSPDAGVPPGGTNLVAVWTGSEMLLTGNSSDRVARYDPSSDTWSLSSPNTLVWRWEHTAVWTGSEMIVWGGRVNSFDALNTGVRYDRSGDSWVPTSMGTAPAPRTKHTAVWTGSEMIVWGGRANDWNGALASSIGGRYSPSTDSWFLTSSINAPSPREGHTAVWTGTEMIVWGGSDNTGGRYEPMSDTWRPTSIGANAPLTVANHVGVWSGKEMIVWTPLPGRAGRYDPVTDSWRTMPQGPNVFFGIDAHPGIWTGRELIVFGRSNGVGGRYDPISNTWSPIAPQPAVQNASHGTRLIWSGSEMIVWGGGFSSYLTNSGARYNPEIDSWVPTSIGPNVPSPRNNPAVVWTGAEMIVWGGGVGGQLYSLDSGGRYDPITDRWTTVSASPFHLAPRAFHSGMWTGTEMIVWGGDPGTSTGGRYCACPFGRLAYIDADGDGFGDPGVSIGTCDGTAPSGYVLDYSDCNDGLSAMLPGPKEACDVTDGVIFEWRPDKNRMSWIAEQGITAWNVYIGDLEVLRASGTYTQTPGSNALAARYCGLTATSVIEPTTPDLGKVSFSLVTGVVVGAEGSLGDSSEGPRANTDPCP